MEFHYGKHHTAYLNNLNGQIAGKPLESLPSVHEVRAVRGGSLCVMHCNGVTGVACCCKTWWELHQHQQLVAACPLASKMAGSNAAPPPLCSLAVQVMMQTWNNGNPTPEFNNAAQVGWHGHVAMSRGRVWLAGIARPVPVQASAQLHCPSWPSLRSRLTSAAHRPCPPTHPQVINHTFFWESMSPNGGGERLPRPSCRSPCSELTAAGPNRTISVKPSSSKPLSGADSRTVRPHCLAPRPSPHAAQASPAARWPRPLTATWAATTSLWRPSRPRVQGVGECAG